MKNKPKISVLFVCMGNICRSPTAEAVFRAKVAAAGLTAQIQIDSAGTHNYHIGKAPDVRTQKAALRRGYDLSALRARQVTKQDFMDFDFVLAMDLANLSILQRLRPLHATSHLGLLLEFARHQPEREVPDPYYGGEDGFEQVLDRIEDAAEGLLIDLRAGHGLT
ncbi:MAG: low molecular weight protein-tyrosine-phosphatase [Gallionella sp.]